MTMERAAEMWSRIQTSPPVGPQRSPGIGYRGDGASGLPGGSAALKPPLKHNAAPATQRAGASASLLPTAPDRRRSETSAGSTRRTGAAAAARGDRPDHKRARRGGPGHSRHRPPPLPAHDPAVAGAGAMARRSTSPPQVRCAGAGRGRSLGRSLGRTC